MYVTRTGHLGVTIHRFESWVSTSTAYDCTQCDDIIRDGDVLEVCSEGVIGIMVGAWPTAVTKAAGEFHTWEDGVEWLTIEDGKYRTSYASACYTLRHSLVADLAQQLRDSGSKDKAVCGDMLLNLNNNQLPLAYATVKAWEDKAKELGRPITKGDLPEIDKALGHDVDNCEDIPF